MTFRLRAQGLWYMNHLLFVPELFLSFALLSPKILFPKTIGRQRCVVWRLSKTTKPARHVFLPNPPTVSYISRVYQKHLVELDHDLSEPQITIEDVDVFFGACFWVWFMQEKHIMGRLIFVGLENLKSHTQKYNDVPKTYHTEFMCLRKVLWLLRMGRGEV
jgi:hypothetical protein